MFCLLITLFLAVSSLGNAVITEEQNVQELWSKILNGSIFNFTFESDSWLLFTSGRKEQRQWDSSTTELSGPQRLGANFMVTKETIPAITLISPELDWSFDATFYIVQNITKKDTESRILFALTSNPLVSIPHTMSNDDLEDFPGLGVLGTKLIIENSMTLEFEPYNNIMPLLSASSDMSCTFSLELNASIKFFLPITFEKSGSSFTIKIIQQDQICNMQMPFTENPDLLIQPMKPFRVAIGAQVSVNESIYVVTAGYSSSANFSIAGLAEIDENATHLERLEQYDEVLTDEALTKELSEFYEDYNRQFAGNLGDDDANNATTVSFVGAKLVPVSDIFLESNLNTTFINKEFWKFGSESFLSDDQRRIILCASQGTGNIISSKPLPSHLFALNSSWQLGVIFDVHVSFVNMGQDSLRIGFTTEKSADVESKFNINVIGAIVEISTSAYKLLGERHAEEIRLYFGNNHVSAKCSSLTSPNLMGQKISVSFRLHKNLLSVEVISVLYADSEKYICSNTLYATDFLSNVRGYEDNIYIVSRALMGYPESNGSIGIDSIRLQRLVEAPTNSEPRFVSGTDPPCNFDCSVEWTSPIPTTLWYHVAKTTTTKQFLPSATGLNRFPVNELKNNDQYKAGDKLICVVSNDLGSVQRAFDVTSQCSSSILPSRERAIVFLKDFGITLAIVCFIPASAKLSIVVYHKILDQFRNRYHRYSRQHIHADDGNSAIINHMEDGSDAL